MIAKHTPEDYAAFVNRELENLHLESKSMTLTWQQWVSLGRNIIAKDALITQAAQTTPQDNLDKVKRHTRKIRNSPDDIYATRVSLGIIGRLREQKARAAVRVAQTEDGQ